ncbi:DUF6879 family protein [Kribbella sp. NPDC051718]|uniref:DUF6879 family protein n=1 Tax=Kribbella sp. NPDC051718 TaxID=3155168 RepID=UPI0034169E64
MLNSFEHTAFRLEVRDRYAEPAEAEPLRQYLAGEPVDLAWLENWFDLVSGATTKGRRISRVRVVTVPLTDYSRLGVYCAQFNNEAGEDIRYLPRTLADDAGLPDPDYWLFDSKILLRMNFGDNDIFMGTEMIDDPDQVVQHNYWRDAPMHHAVRRDEFAGQQHRERRHGSADEL